MNKSKVSLVRCDSYDEDQVFGAIEQGINLLGGLSQFVTSEERIVLKPNVLFGTNPQKCVSTHPAVLKAAGRILLEAGANVSYGDSSGLGKCEKNMGKAHLKQAADELGIRMADFDNGQTVSHPDGLLIKQFFIANGVMESDGLISLPKLKTHGLTRFTGAIKNQFGCIPGTLKSQFHVKLPDPHDFATMLVDLNTLIRPRLYIMDGITAMEGNGPRSGRPKQMGVLLLSADPVALDATACKIINLDPEMVPTSKPGEKAGLGTYHDAYIDVIGEAVGSFVDHSFEVVRKPPVRPRGILASSFSINRVCPRPVIAREKCTFCGTCVNLCPVDPKAVNWHDGNTSNPPKYKYDRCIRCFCCQEMCPDGAIEIKNPILGRIIFR